MTLDARAKMRASMAHHQFFTDPAMAAGYATARPWVHPSIIARLRAWRGSAAVDLAADIGCGGGLSTRALLDVANRCVGFDPSEAMIRAARHASPGARFLVASAEAIPLASRTVDLLTAAGSLNYVPSLDAVWAEARRVLTPRGTLAVYDVATGRSFADGTDLDEWFEGFVARYPYPPREARPLSAESLATIADGFAVDHAETFDVPLVMRCESYLSYVLTESNSHHAVRGGAPLETVRSWCLTTLSRVFAGRVRTVTFRAYLASLTAR
jgi:SAM-dependent methyltransferase